MDRAENQAQSRAERRAARTTRREAFLKEEQERKKSRTVRKTTKKACNFAMSTPQPVPSHSGWQTHTLENRHETDDGNQLSMGAAQPNHGDGNQLSMGGAQPNHGDADPRTSEKPTEAITAREHTEVRREKTQHRQSNPPTLGTLQKAVQDSDLTRLERTASKATSSPCQVEPQSWRHDDPPRGEPLAAKSIESVASSQGVINLTSEMSELPDASGDMTMDPRIVTTARETYPRGTLERLKDMIYTQFG